MTKLNLLVVGCGAMGGALIKGWQRQGNYQVTVISPSKAEAYKGVDDLEANYNPHVVVMAVKPQLLAEILPMYSRFKTSLFISIAAGLRISFYEQILGANIKMIRAMPNLAVQVNEGVSAYIANQNCSADEINIAEQLFAKVGIVAQLQNEKLFDAVTALSGSGPAYVFYLCECMAKAGIALGLDHDMAYAFARQTIIGSGAILKNSDLPPKRLRQNVTSQGGTTEAALDVLMSDDGLQNIMYTTLKSAFMRAQQMAKT